MEKKFRLKGEKNFRSFWARSMDHCLEQNGLTDNKDKEEFGDALVLLSIRTITGAWRIKYRFGDDIFVYYGGAL